MQKFVYNDGGRESAGYKGKSGDCVARSIAIITKKPYQEVYERLANGNATQRRSKKESKSKAGVKTASRGISAKRKWFEEYMTELGFEWIPTMQIGQGCKVHLNADEMPKGRLIASVSKHFVAMIDGVIHDTYDCSREGKRCVYGYYKYNKNMDAIKPTEVTFEQWIYFQNKGIPVNYCLQQWQVVEWLRVNHGIWIEVTSGNMGWSLWAFSIHEKGLTFIKYCSNTHNQFYDSPQEAYSAAFDYIKQNNLIP